MVILALMLMSSSSPANVQVPSGVQCPDSNINCHSSQHFSMMQPHYQL